jgi:hypothetical protein
MLGSSVRLKTELTKSTWDKKSHPCTKCGNLTQSGLRDKSPQLTDKFRC